MISDTKRINPIRLLILPYLHERRIYLNRKKLNTDYFYTTIETKDAEEQAYYNAIDQTIKNGQPIDSINIIEAMKGKPVN